MVGDGSDFTLVSCNSNSSSSSSSSTREMVKTDLDTLPNDMVSEILVRIPAQDILDAAVFVCRKWYEIIHARSFALSHLHHSPPGFVIRNKRNNEISFMSMTQNGEVVISKFSHKFRHNIWWSSCNGLMLEMKSSDENQLIITNPMTKQRFALPRFFARSLSPYGRSAIAYDATHMKYKVIRTYCLGLPNPCSRMYCAILTVGVDKSWRTVDTQHLSLATTRHFKMCPLVTEGFVHWTEDRASNSYLVFSKENGIITAEMRQNYVLTLNMETEIITHIPAPRCDGVYYYYKYFSGGSCLSLLIGRDYLKWEVWEMKPETGEWTRLPDIDLEAHKGLLNESYDGDRHFKPGDGDCLDCKLVPTGWLKYREVIVLVCFRPVKCNAFRQARLRVVYNVKTQDITLFKLDINYHPYIAHRNSLVRMLD